MLRVSRVESDASSKSITPPTDTTVRKRKMTDEVTSERPENYPYSTRRRITAKSASDDTELTQITDPPPPSDPSKRVLRSRK